MRRCVTLAILAATACASAQTGWSRYRVTALNDAQARRISDSPLGLFSENVVVGETDLIVGPGEIKHLYALRLPYVKVSDLPDPRNWDERPQTDDYTDSYLRYDAMIQQYETWRTQYPDLITRTNIGTTWGGRTVWCYRFFNNMAGDRLVRHAFVMTCGIHAREWISPAVGMYVMDRLILSSFTRGGFSATVPLGTAFYIVPSLNPDGYEYTWTNNRMWRKNRRNNGSSFGVDLNRNFSKGWGLNSGSSGSPSSDTYRGPSAFSEPESNGLRNYLDTLPPIRAHIDFHSYGQKILSPWGYTTANPPGHIWLMQTGNLMKSAVFNIHGRDYEMGPTSTTLYMVSGKGPDYTYDRWDAAAYTIELRDTGEFGFLLPENQIKPTQEEAWAGVQALVLRMLSR